MCGIAGLMTTGPAPDAATLDRLAAALQHRGPDGQGRHVAGTVGLVHTRLSIIDLDGGRQPLHGPGGTALVANGEIYNYRELGAGMTLATGSDCEPPLYLYAAHGVDMVDRLRGMYALALYDPGHNDGPERLILARDPFGIKPLYVVEGAFGVAFASEPQALVAAGVVRPAVDGDRRDEVLQLQFSTGAAIPLKNIRRVLPGETLVVEGGRIVSATRRAALPAPSRLAPVRDEDASLAAFEAAMTESVDLHQRSDVPYGMFLSGGVDSSVVLALMARLNDRPVLAFTAGFPGTGVADERAHARAVARACGAEHVEVEVTERDFWDHLPAMVAAMDDPAADYAIVPTWLLARTARQSVKVILSGEGGDELFGGYGRYRGAMRPWPLTKAMRRKGTFDGLDVLRRPPSHWRAGIAAAEATARAAGGTALQRAQRVDCADWLPNDLLGKLDRCLMAHGMEGRVPFLDPGVAALAFALPDRVKVRGGQGKWLVRRWLAKALPESRPFEPKRGFTVPVGEWIAARGADLGPLVAASPGVCDIAHPEAVAALFTASGKRERFAAWTLLFLALWHRRHVLGQSMDGGVFDVLSTTP